jgi:hypothetical protein
MSGVQGRSFYPLLTGQNVAWRDSFLYEYFWERNFPQTPTVLGVRTDRFKFMKFHGTWDRMELYDLQNDPDELHNLIGDAMVRHEAASTDVIAAQKADPEIQPLLKEMEQRLAQLLKETGCSPEPNWQPSN